MIKSTNDKIVKTKINKNPAWRVVSVLLVLVLLVAAGCGSSKGGEEQKSISMYDLNKAMMAAASFPEMRNASDTDKDAQDSFSYLSEMDYEKIQHFFLSYASTDGDTEEVAVIQVKDEQDLEEAVKSLEDHLESRIKLFGQYEPKKVQELKEGEVFSDGLYAVLIVHKDKDKIKAEFKKATAQ